VRQMQPYRPKPEVATRDLPLELGRKSSFSQIWLEFLCFLAIVRIHNNTVMAPWTPSKSVDTLTKIRPPFLYP